ncbi:radical SAM protein [Synergistales bacterium]|nr:radical SAM protein [Synergistales bacterium]
MADISRAELYKQLPLTTPFSLHIFPSYFCNFRCSYCLHSLSDEALKNMRFERQMMPLDIYKKAIDDLSFFPDRFKALIFAGHGEPLTHPDIAKMVAYAKEKRAADRVEIVTNGSLLTQSLSRDLIDAGVDRLKISIQGTSALKYKNVSSVDVDFDIFLKNLAWFYEHKTITDVYIKIIDVALDGKEDEERFQRLFAPLADMAAVEYAIPFVKEIDYNSYGKNTGLAKQGHKAKGTMVCAMPFYMIVLAPNGDVLPCCSTEIPISFGNINEESLSDIWNSSLRKRFLALQLRNRFDNAICARCSVPNFGLQEGDYLDDYKEELTHLYNL